MIKLYLRKHVALFTCLALLFITCFHASSQISTFAGRHTYLGDGNAAAKAALFSPHAMVMDGAGNIYIATTKDSRVRKIDAVTKVITTIAGTGISGYSGDGGLATLAQLDFIGGLPGLGVDNVGNVYIGDYINNRVRKIDAITKIITTIAGIGVGGYAGDGGPATSAKISGPAGIVVDANGNVYFADNNNSAIRRIDATTKYISTVAGTGFSGYSGDGGLATAAMLNYPERFAFDASGNLYISDEYNHVIRKVDKATQKISTIVGTGGNGFTGDGGPAISASFTKLLGVAVDTSGNIYIADQLNNRIRKVDAKTQIVNTIAGSASGGYSGDGGVATLAQLNSPSDVLVDKSGNVYIDDNGNNVVRVVNKLGIISTIIGDGSDGFSGAPPALSAQMVPQAVALDNLGNLIIADGYYYDVRAVNIANSSFIYAGNPNPDPKYASRGYGGNGNFASLALFNAPVAVAVDASNNVYIADVFNNVIRKITYSSKFIANYAGNATAGFSGDAGAATSAQLNNPYGIAVDKNGNLYIADALNNRVRKVTAAGTISTIAGNGTVGSTGDGSAATSAELNFPYGVAVDTALNVFIIDKNNKVRMVAAATQKISTVLNNSHVLKGIATDVAGNIFLSDSTASSVIKLTAKTYALITIAGNGTAGYSGDGGTATSGQLNSPGGLVVNSLGNIYVADVNNYVVRQIIPGVVITPPITNNVVSTTDSVSTCTGTINIHTLNGTLPSGGIGVYTYQWLKSTDSVAYTAISGATAQNYAVNAAITKTTFYRRLVTSGTVKDSGNVIGFHVHVNPVPVITLSGKTSFCKGTKDTLTTSAAYTNYAWSRGDVTRQIIDSLSGTFTVTVTNAFGCVGTSASVTLTENALPAVPKITSSPASTTNLCAGTSAILISSSALSYKWNTGAATDSVTVSTAGSYTVTVANAAGCTATSTAKTVSYRSCGIPPSPKTVSVKTASAIVSWRKVPCAVSYKLQYALYGSATWTNTVIAADTLYTITGLTNSTTYQWHVSTVCEVSPSVTSAYTTTISFKTPVSFALAITAPSSASDVQLSNDGNTAFNAMVYPNPAVSIAKLSLIGTTGKVLVTVTDMSGRVLWQSADISSNELQIPVNTFARGMYFIIVKDEKHNKVLKLVRE